MSSRRSVPAPLRSSADLIGFQAKKYEQTLYQNLQSMSHTLQPSLETHSRNAHEDVLSALLEHARSSLLYERQLLKEFELLRPELTGIRKMETGVTGVSGGVYYHPTSPGTVQGSPRAAASNLSRASSIASSSAGPPSSSAVVVRSASAGPRPPSADDASLRSASSTSTMGRSTMNTPAKRGAVPDQRQRVDVRHLPARRSYLTTGRNSPGWLHRCSRTDSDLIPSVKLLQSRIALDVTLREGLGAEREIQASHSCSLHRIALDAHRHCLRPVSVPVRHGYAPQIAP